MTVPGTGWKNDLLLALSATLVVLTINAVSGFPTLRDYGADNDSMLRLVEVRDLLAGQSWFDLHQYRMGTAGGFVMHWSRLVDTPLVLIIMAFDALGASTATAERAAQIIWPTLLYGLTIFVLIRGSQRFASADVAMPAVILSTAALFFLVIYSPGVIDHHNVQLLLTAASLWLLMEATSWRPAALLSGICAGLTLAVGMETAPYVAVLGICAAVLFILDDKERVTARGFGLGFAGVACLVFVATIRPADWGIAQCDAFSSFQFAIAALSGLGLATAGMLTASTARARLASMLMLAVVVAAVAIVVFPQCLASPYAAMDERVRIYWLNDVVEAQPFWSVAVHQPKLMAARYVTPFIAILLIGLQLRSRRLRREEMLAAVLLIVAFGVSLWQVRGSTFSVALAVLPLSAWIAKIRLRASAAPSWRVSTGIVMAWLVSLNATWAGVAVAAQSVVQKAPQRVNSDADHAVTCGKPADFRDLAAMPATTVLASSNLGSGILMFTNHRALAGPYHRNVGGNLAMLDAFMGTPDAARAVIEREHVGLIAICSGNTEEISLGLDAPKGLAAELLRGDVPQWLELDRSTAGKPIEIYKVR
ncbi:GtrA family protein [Mesorhizobium sp. M2D.F.Ca.ET.185.01.1.1]|uniref:GtrA family protein n=2 Tax=Mesorhizobium TaxID=68287 RepID=UPI000FCC6B9F|nr:MULTISPECIES: GtrA family protein [unclassified Mesorhizobium]TGP83285.1 GtrA family protein [bacterium M00.F.Ca.ET.227.01.1.1]TGP99240.1 GtrA family protein [bacterium M00.F.Ca.ET.221.01.1.1]TGP99970.1 GtrA family protein [bacterium M00.F.Ca.ET.222.01.1.1]TGT78383.1 GtrA family protein [bacterium M00.F.Ca.ET.159.01.1.1]TGT89050.1 GtrA family protein [bacterium M00.F.Ca.ET.157.01.1.1]TGU11356.1 GtrA family protein [bacterium M00.F.Ca.ET.163.01.1.1]TGU34953.1 GtrA family protein [bacterium